jgi:hypothetical protein
MEQLVDRPAIAPQAARWLERSMSWLRPGGTRGGREAYQLRFMSGAILLGVLVSALALPAATAMGQWLSVGFLGTFLVVLLLQAGAVRLGAPVGLVAWTVVVTVGLFLVATALVPGALQAHQLYWFLLIPLAARALAVPRHDDGARPRSWRTELVAGAAALMAAVLVIACYAAGLNFGQPASSAPAYALGIDFALFLVSALGLLYVDDLSVRETAAELRRLQELLSICAWCRKIQDGGAWVGLEQYVARRQNVSLSHGMCPACYERHVPRGTPSDA